MESISNILNSYDLSGVLEYCFRHNLVTAPLIVGIIYQSYPDLEEKLKEYKIEHITDYLTENYNIIFRYITYQKMMKLEDKIQKKQDDSIRKYIDKKVNVFYEDQKAYIIPDDPELDYILLNPCTVIATFDEKIKGTLIIEGIKYSFHIVKNRIKHISSVLEEIS